MTADDLTANMAADPPVTVDGTAGPVTVTGAVWEEAPDLLADLVREADEWRNLYPDLEDDQ